MPTCCWSSSQPRDAQPGSVPIFPFPGLCPAQGAAPSGIPQHLLLAWAGFDQSKSWSHLRQGLESFLALERSVGRAGECCIIHICTLGCFGRSQVGAQGGTSHSSSHSSPLSQQSCFSSSFIFNASPAPPLSVWML